MEQQYLSIQKISELTGISTYTLRYYEKNGLIHPITRAAGGRRQYSAGDLEWIRFLLRLRTTGMSIRQMQQAAHLRRQGPSTAKERRQLLEAHLESIKKQIEALQEHQDAIEDKIVVYKQWEEDYPLKEESK
ncbi:MerR family transcriptional regulator [Paenibacillus zeisoli]|uniref:MerR family transcriptional regulator n=1 Tax=Paenibacillus zeisoli TaxID=2496267 RepID=A0A433X1Y2_9BACL|nr:MerR family transcriptional regulator [Paenibacillus zeisoli]RUT28119.1 MerR family transcriptional regulator [Paenibacillus zeisoli]